MIRTLRNIPTTVFLWALPFIARAGSTISIDGTTTAINTPETRRTAASLLGLMGGVIGILVPIGIFIAIIMFMTSSGSIPARKKSKSVFKLAGIGVVLMGIVFYSAMVLLR